MSGEAWAGALEHGRWEMAGTEQAAGAMAGSSSLLAPSVPQFPLTAGSHGLCGWGQHPSLVLWLQEHLQGPVVTLLHSVTLAR